ncbi:pyruvate, water dikinase regulatory protein [Thioalkalivibrio thiocyanoxidans]|uniref:pyruvate, water dikinase regulatory protein n=1 Tax=Thioalkalivibrio thiocyanoxidans TaxID=152475 RepID=UPI00035C3CE2|nr:pyruvate, water dikinase regulatory protein [Thioalkalivibrio thiocyanoxidans]
MADPRCPQVYLVSDGTGITAETLARSLFTQFPDLDPAWHRLPFVQTPGRLSSVFARIGAGPQPAVVVATLANADLRQDLRHSPVPVIDVFGEQVGRLEEVLGVTAQPVSGRAHGMGDVTRYDRRIEALNYTLSHDDGLSTQDLSVADVVLLGASRSGKTPTSLYLAMNYGLFAANYPLVPEDLGQDDTPHMPRSLRGLGGRLVGLTITPQRLSQIREGRRPGSQYASLGQCRAECAAIQEFLEIWNIPHLDVTELSIEEIATQVRDTLDRIRGT